MKYELGKKIVIKIKKAKSAFNKNNINKKNTEYKFFFL